MLMYVKRKKLIKHSVNLNVKCDGGLMRQPTNDARYEPLIPTP